MPRDSAQNAIQTFHSSRRVSPALLGSSAHYERIWAGRERLDAIPTLIVWGSKDPLFGTLLERWRSGLPHATVLELPTAGHWPHEEEPDAVARAVARHLM